MDNAFPMSYGDKNGMSLRDWFAGHALTTLHTIGQKPAKEYARQAYVLADAMLEEREKTPSTATNAAKAPT